MAERIVSPGVFTRENDLSFLAQGIGEIGAAFIGPFKQGPVFVPTIVRTQSEFESIFGTPDGTYYTEYAVQNYLREAGVATIVRVGGVGGYQQTGSLAIFASGSQNQSLGTKLIGVLHSTKNGFQNYGFQGAIVSSNSVNDGSFILSGSNTLINIGPASFSGSMNISGSTTITGSLIVSGGTINVIGTNLISASSGVTLANTTGYSTFSSSLSQSISHSVSNLSSSIGALSGSVSATINSKFGSIVVTPFLSKSNYESYTSSIVEPRLASLEAASGSIRLAHNEHTASVNFKSGRGDSDVLSYTHEPRTARKTANRTKGVATAIGKLTKD